MRTETVKTMKSEDGGTMQRMKSEFVLRFSVWILVFMSVTALAGISVSPHSTGYRPITSK